MKFDISDIARYKFGGYLVAKNMEINFLNAALADPEARNKGMKIASDFLTSVYEEGVWETAQRHMHQLSEAKEVRRHISDEMIASSPHGNGMEAQILFSFCVGSVAVEKEDEKYIAILTQWLIDADWTGFQLAFHPSEEYLRAFTASERFSQQYLAGKMMARGEDMESWQKYFDSLSLDDKIKYVSTPMFANGCWHFLEYLDFLTILLIRNKKYGLLADRLVCYTIPEIQFALLASIKDPEDVVMLFKALTANVSTANEQKSIIFRLILNHWLENIIRIKSEYSVPLPTIKKDERLDEIWKENRTRFEETLPDLMINAFLEFLQALSPKQLSDWLFSIPMPDAKRETEYTKAKQLVLVMAREVLLSLTSSKGFDKDMRDLAYLDAYAQNADKMGDAKETFQLAEAISEALFCDRQYLMGDMSNDLLSRIHSLSFAMRNGLRKNAGEIFNSTINRFRLKYEGIKPTPWRERHERAVIENQILMVLLYMTILNESDNNKKLDFKSISRYLLRQSEAASASGFDSSCYLRAILLAELIVSQALPDLKEEFESECIRLYPDFCFLLQVFNCCQGNLSTHARAWLQFQYTKEWPIIKNRMDSRNQKEEVKLMEEIYHKIVSNQ